MTAEERNAVIEECAAVAGRELDGDHAGNLRARQIAEVLRTMKMPPYRDYRE